MDKPKVTKFYFNDDKTDGLEITSTDDYVYFEAINGQTSYGAIYRNRLSELIWYLQSLLTDGL